MQVTVIRQTPPVVVGSCGPVHDRAFEVFEAELDAIEYEGASVDRLAPAEKEASAVPIVRVNGSVVSAGRYPSRREWAHAIGAARLAD